MYNMYNDMYNYAKFWKCRHGPQLDTQEVVFTTAILPLNIYSSIIVEMDCDLFFRGAFERK